MGVGRNELLQTRLIISVLEIYGIELEFQELLDFVPIHDSDKPMIVEQANEHLMATLTATATATTMWRSVMTRQRKKERNVRNGGVMEAQNR